MVFSGDRSHWDAFNWDRHSSLKAVKPIIVDWYNALPDSGALVLAGNNGSGKSHIAKALYNLFGHWRASFYGEVALAKAIQKTYDDRSLSEDGFIKQALFRPDLFILDDLGTYQAKDQSFIQNVYRRIFDDYLTVQKGALLITTNLPLMTKRGGDIRARIGGRSFSRLCGAMTDKTSYIDLFNVPDFRIEQFVGRG